MGISSQAALFAVLGGLALHIISAFQSFAELLLVSGGRYGLSSIVQPWRVSGMVSNRGTEVRVQVR